MFCTGCNANCKHNRVRFPVKGVLGVIEGGRGAFHESTAIAEEGIGFRLSNFGATGAGEKLGVMPHCM